MPGEDEGESSGGASRLGSADGGPAPEGEAQVLAEESSSGEGLEGDGFTEVTHQSWLDRIAESIVGVLFGLVLVLGACVLLFWNEGRAVRTARSLTEGAGLVVEAAPGRVDPAQEGQLVHLSGDLVTPTPLQDPTFAVSATGARLVRKVEMYQWREDKRTETRKKLGGGEETTTTYRYTRVWADHAIPSGGFRQAGHANPSWGVDRAEWVSRDAALGAFRPGEEALRRLPASEAVRLPAEHRASLRGQAGHVVDGVLYFGDSALPRIGDLRISYALAPQGPARFIGRQTGSGLVPYQAEAGDQILLAASGLAPAESMFTKAQTDNRVLTWLLRALGLLAMFVGWFLVLRPLSVVADVVPLVGDVVGLGLSVASLFLTAVLGPLVIAFAWAWARPLLSLGILAGGLTAAMGLRWLAAGRRAARGGASTGLAPAAGQGPARAPA